MKTFGEFRKFFATSQVEIEIFGASEEIREAFRERCRAVGSAICQERNMTSVEAKGLPADAELGEKSRELAEGLKTWFSLETPVRR